MFVLLTLQDRVQGHRIACCLPFDRTSLAGSRHFLFFGGGAELLMCVICMHITSEPSYVTWASPVLHQGLLGTEWTLDLIVKLLPMELGVRTRFSHFTHWAMEKRNTVAASASIDLSCLIGHSICVIPLYGCIPINFVFKVKVNCFKLRGSSKEFVTFLTGYLPAQMD